MIKAILFDFDGTLIESANDLITAIHQTLSQNNIEFDSQAELANSVSSGLRAMLNKATENRLDSSQIEKLFYLTLEQYDSNGYKQTKLYSGINKLLTGLKCFGIVTNKPRHNTLAIIANIQVLKLAKVIVCRDDVSKIKPDPEGLLMAANKLAIKPYEIVYCGDHHKDIIAAKAAGMKSIACGFGYIENDDDFLAWQADYCVNSVTELTTICFNLTNNSHE